MTISTNQLGDCHTLVHHSHRFKVGIGFKTCFFLILANDDQVKLVAMNFFKFEDDQCLGPSDTHLKLVTPKIEEAHLMMANSKWSSMTTKENRQTLSNHRSVTISSVVNSKRSPSAPKKQQEMNIINMLVAISSGQALLCECCIKHLQHHQQ